MDIEKTLLAILERNKRVEADKAWEVSVVRRGFLTISTYIIAAIVLWTLGEERYVLTAMIPAGGYLLSTLTLPPLKRWWMRRYAGNGDA